MKRILTAVAAAAAALLLASCAPTGETGEGGNDDIELAIVSPYYVVPQVKDIVDNLQVGLEEEGITASIADAQGDFNKLNGQIQDAASRGVDGIVVVTGDPAQMSVGLAAAKAADVPVFMMLSAQELVDGLTGIVTADDQDGGEVTAQAMIDGYESGTVLIFGNDAEASLRLKTQVAMAAFDEAGIPYSDTVQVLDPSTAVQVGLDETTNYILANPGELGGVWSADDNMAFGALQAIEQAGLDVPVVGNTGSEQALALVESSGNFSTYRVAPDEIVTETIGVITRFFAGGEAGEEIFVKGVLITTDNVADYLP